MDDNKNYREHKEEGFPSRDRHMRPLCPMCGAILTQIETADLCPNCRHEKHY